MSEFMGKNGFNWFVGVVEDREDPKTLGRIKVRCLGYHTEDLTILPTDDLPWAHPMNPITSATVSGIGQTPLGVVEGTWVVGFFQDGPDAQMPIIIGTLPGVPSKLPEGDSRTGFQDYVYKAYPKYKETDVNRLAVNLKELSPEDQQSWAGGEGWSMDEFSGADEETETNPHPSLTIRRADIDEAVGTAQIDGIMDGVAPIAEDLDQEIEGKWDEPKTPYAAKYPHNHVYESESGHLREYDDTKDAERIHERHMSGSGYEIGPDGTKITRVKKDNYTIITENDYAHIQGNSRTTHDKDIRVRVNAEGQSGNSYNIEVGQGSHVNVEVNGGDINLTTLASGMESGDINLNSARDLNIQVNRRMRVEVLENVEVDVMGKWTETVTKSKEESTKTHWMNANNQHMTGDSLVDINSASVDIDGGVINLN